MNVQLDPHFTRELVLYLAKQPISEALYLYQQLQAALQSSQQQPATGPKAVPSPPQDEEQSSP